MVRFAMAAVLVLAAAGEARAGAILNPFNGANAQINAFEPVGNSFVAVGPAAAAALYLEPILPGADPSDPIRLELYEGYGASGTPLLGRDVAVIPGFAGFLDVDLSSVALVAGREYSLVASVVGDSPYWAIGASDGPNGRRVGGGGPLGFAFYALRVTPAAVVPEPSTLALAAPALLLGLVGWRWRRRRAA